MEFISSYSYSLIGLLSFKYGFISSFLSLFVLLEIPLQIFIVISIMTKYLNESFSPTKRHVYYPKVSCLVTCYNEGRDIIQTMDSLTQQIYKGTIETLIIIDGASVNKETVDAANEYMKNYKKSDRRILRIVPKWSRGGHASSINLGVRLCKGEIFITLDGDCSCDNDMVSNMVQSFYDKDNIASSGTLRVRNINTNILTRLQGIEYMLGIHMSRIALASANSLNNVSGAFGAFRKSFMLKTSGWHNGSAEDMDMTIRLQSYFNRHKNLKVGHCPKSIVHTDAPTSIIALFKQRMRWDGDIYYIYVYRHKKRLSPKYLGKTTFLITIVSGLFMHAILPMAISSGIIYSIISFPLPLFFAMMSLIYIYYLIINSVFFVIFIVLVSERKKQDIKLCWVLLFMPIYTTVIKFVTSIAIICEIALKSHRDSSMAPVWVNKKVR